MFRILTLMTLTIATSLGDAHADLHIRITCVAKEGDLIDSDFPLVKCKETENGYRRLALKQCDSPLSIPATSESNYILPLEKLLVNVSVWQNRRSPERVTCCSSWISRQRFSEIGAKWEERASAAFFAHAVPPSKCISLGLSSVWAVATSPLQEEVFGCYFQLTSGSK